jgi:hypothetical protein
VNSLNFKENLIFAYLCLPKNEFLEASLLFPVQTDQHKDTGMRVRPATSVRGLFLSVSALVGLGRKLSSALFIAGTLHLKN